MTFTQAVLIRTDGSSQPLASVLNPDSIREMIDASSLCVMTLWKHKATMYVDDLGDHLDLPVNPRATQLYLEHCRPGVDWSIRGNVVVVPDGRESEQ